MSTRTESPWPPLADPEALADPGATVPDPGEVQRRFRQAAGRFPTGVTVVSTIADGAPHGITVNAFATVSLYPLLVLVAFTNHSRTLEYVRASGMFAVTVLGAHQQDVARWFANPNRPSGAEGFAEVAWRAAPQTGSPVLIDGVSYFDCVVDGTHTAGDHTVVIGRVQTFDLLADCSPLLFVRSRFTGAHPSDPR